MKFRNVILAILLFGLSVQFGNGQSNSVSEVEKTVGIYFDGYKAGDANVLKTVFHENFRLSWSDPWKGNILMQVDREGLFEFFGPQWSTLKISTEILETKVLDRSAHCLAKITLEGIVVWTDHINLLKLDDGKWWIVSKISEGELVH